MNQKSCNFGDKIELSFCITNTGKVAAKETAFLFVAHKSDKVFLPEKELREFIKVLLQPGETRQVTVQLDTKTFGYYNALIHDWYAESGDYTIMVGSSTINCCLEAVIQISSPEMPQPDLREVTPSYYNLLQKELRIPEQEFRVLYGKELPVSDSQPVRPYNHSNNLEDVKHTLIGKIIIRIADKMAKNVTQSSKEEEGMMSSMIKEMPFHSMVTSSDGIITENRMEGILDLLNGHYIKGIKKLLSKR
jgi:beta-glucosidase